MQESFFDRAKLGSNPAKLGDQPQYKQPEFDGDGQMVYSVQECHFLVNEAVSRLGRIHVKGEITEVNPRGMAIYFKLRDADGKDYTISCIIFQSQAKRFSHLLEVGLEITVSGRAELYKTGTFNLKIEDIKPSGEGAWKKEFEALKKKLAAKGYFDESAKKPIPFFVQKIGVITSEAGKAIQDFRKNLGSYDFQVFLYDVRVEGERAEKEIVQAFKWFNLNRLDMDVLVLIRGGGSAENLVVFHSEKIADAIRASRIPVITGIGHETDESIADYVADKWLNAPTAVGAFLTHHREGLIRHVDTLQEHLQRNMQDVLQGQKYAVHTQAERLHRGFGRVFEGFRSLKQRLVRAHYAYEKQLYAYLASVERAQSMLASLNPEHVLQRGYSVVFTEEKKVLRDSGDVRIGEKVLVRLFKGRLGTRVEERE